jgi:monofunctional biosynthetic peptidoglycan transglycosylase
VALGVALTLPLRWFDPPTTAFMLQDDSGRDPLLQEWQRWEQLGSVMALAVVAAEDQRFDSHFGLDLDSIRDSIESAQDGGRMRGASTISQQVAKNLYLWPGRNLARKGLEAYFTLLLEACLSKKRILEIYLNIAEFGPGIYGVAAASRYYFGKPPSRLYDAEAALLAAVLPNPRRFRVDEPSDYVRERQSWILGQMQRLRREGWITTLD